MAFSTRPPIRRATLPGRGAGSRVSGVRGGSGLSVAVQSNAADRAEQLRVRIREWVDDLGRKRVITIAVDSSTKRKPYPRLSKPNRRGDRRVVRETRRAVKAVQPTNADVLRYFIERRNFLEVNPFARDYMRREAYQRVLDSGRASLPTGQQLGFYIGAAWKALVIERITNSGYDLNPAPLSWEWAEFKHRRNLHPGIGRASDQLLIAIKRAQIVVRPM